MAKKTSNDNIKAELPADALNTAVAKKIAEKDIVKDGDLGPHHKNDDLDEGELARLGGGRNKLA